MSKSKDEVQGEGNYEAAREYDEQAERFAKSGKVDEAARNAAPKDEEEAREMERAEKAGRSRAHGEDPLLQGDSTDGGPTEDPTGEQGR